MTKEQKFFNALRDVFVGAKVEGYSGYINLMRIKSRYYAEGVFPKLSKDIDEALKPFPHFREEMFDKLYTFFNRYFSESGSIYFRYTPLHQNVYEKVYTDDKDVMLFYKTHMLYYVKTDRLFKNLDVELDAQKFFFDVSTLEHKKANEKREIIYALKEKRKDGTVVFTVTYSERGRKTRTDEILKALKKDGTKLSEELLERAFRVFERQSEVDYFINKNAKAFLEEQFNLWLYQYVFSGESDWTETRIKQLQTLKDIALKIIAFISQFEDELVKIWNKPKFVLNSNYVITLDRIASAPTVTASEAKQSDSSKKSEIASSRQKASGFAMTGSGVALIEKLLSHKNFPAQVEEWKQLGMVDGKFKKTDIFEEDLTSKHLSKKYRHLPIDTKHFKDMELDVLALFDNLDEALDGWLIKSENYQALNTILPKFKAKVQTIYIDPPFNKEDDADYLYSVKYKDASWISILENRLQLSKDVLGELGSIYVKCDYNGDAYVRMLMNDIFGSDRFLSEIIWRRFTGTKSQFQHFSLVTDTIFAFSKTQNWIWEQQYKPYSEEYLKSFKHKDKRGKYLLRNFYSPGDGPSRTFFGNRVSPPAGHHWRISQEKIDMYIEEERIVLDQNGFPKLKNYLHEMQGTPYNNMLEDIHVVQGVSKEFFDFATQNPEKLISLFVKSSSEKKGIVLDFFLGSGSTIAVAHKLGRKWIGVEMGDQYNSQVLPRMKEVLSGTGQHEPCGISKEVDWQGGGFFKYYDLEQYESSLQLSKYEDSTLFDDPNQNPYHPYVFLRDLKMLEALEVDLKKNTVKVDLSKLYTGIDIAETLSNLTGKWIKRITRDSVEFVDGENIDLNNLDYKLIKPLIWW